MRRRSGLTSAPIEFLPRRFYLVVVQERKTCSIHRTRDTASDTPLAMPMSERHLFPRTPGIQFVSLQEELVPQGSEFILGIPQTIRFNAFLTSIMNSGSSSPLLQGAAMQSRTSAISGTNSEKTHYFFLRRRHLRDEIQAVHLICRWRLLYLQLPPHEALAPFGHLPYFFSSFLSSSDSFDPPSLLVSLAGIAKGLEKELLGNLNVGTTDTLAAVSDGEANIWTISRRFVICSRSIGEHKETSDGADSDHQSTDLEDTISALQRRKVSLVVTLAKIHGDTNFAARGMEILDILSTAASSTTISLGDKLVLSDEVLVSRFLEACESTEGVIAVVASNNSGVVMAATCIGCYLMKHSNFTSHEAIGWLQLCLPVKTPLTTELFLGQMQPQMWLEGERFRRASEGDFPDEITEYPTTDSMHINIGKISLGRLSLLGTRDRDKARVDPFTANIPVSTCLSSRSHEPQSSPTAATTTAQLKRRPLTQGSIGSRRYHRSTDGPNGLRADFALMHKFLHQTPPPAKPRSTTNSSTNSSASSNLHTVPSRPKASSRSPDGTPANCTEALA